MLRKDSNVLRTTVGAATGGIALLNVGEETVADDQIAGFELVGDNYVMKTRNDSLVNHRQANYAPVTLGEIVCFQKTNDDTNASSSTNHTNSPLLGATSADGTLVVPSRMARIMGPLSFPVTKKKT